MVKLISSIAALVQSILDRMPSRKEALLNEIRKVKDELYKMQSKNTPWNINDSIAYELLLNKLRLLEDRAKNAG